jgi:hypothetical protein
MIQTHELKTDSHVFWPVACGDKTYEIRKDDRPYTWGDILHLRETKYTGEEMAEGKPLEYTGREVYCKITHILRGPEYGLKDGWCILSIAGVIGN